MVENKIWRFSLARLQNLCFFCLSEQKAPQLRKLTPIRIAVSVVAIHIAPRSREKLLYYDICGGLLDVFIRL